MIRLKHIVSILLLAVTTLVAAQETYVIDSVCVGAERTYRRDGEKGNFYDWYIIDTQAADTAGVFGADFTDITGTDTIWGNEIAHIWDAVGEFDIVVYVTTEHSCDTLEQGRVKVFDPPGVFAGVDQTICSMEDIALTGDSAWNYSGMYWESTGDGAFSDTFALHPTYYLGAADSISGSVTLFITAYGMAENITCDPAVDSVTFFFSNPEIDLQVVDVLCYGDSSAFIKANVSGGLAPYTYSWSGPDGFTSSNDSISELITGTYVLTVTDDNDCSTTDSSFITQPEEILVSIDSVQNLSCYQSNDGFIWASGSGGTGNLTFEWTGYSGFTASGDSIDLLPADTFLLSVTDENGCVVIDTVVLTEPEPLFANIDSVLDILCFNDNTGAAHVEVIGGTAPFTIEWNTSPAQDSVWATNLTPGEYIVSVTDANNCSALDTIVISEPVELFVNVDSIQNVSCYGASDGLIVVSATGGTDTLTFDWVGYSGYTTTGDSIYNLPADTFLVSVTDVNGCVAYDTVVITEPEPLLVNIDSVIDILCFGDSTGAAHVEVFGGTAPYTIQWNTTPVQDSAWAIDLEPGEYVVTVTDANNCSVNDTVIINEPIELIVSIDSVQDVLCFGGSDGFILSSATGGTGALTFEWTGYSSGTYLGDSIYNLPADTFLLTVSDENNCSVIDTVIVLEPEPLLTNIDSIIDAQCYDENNGAAHVEVIGGTGPFTYQWNTVPVQDSAWATNLAPGQYIVTVADINFCEITDTVDITQPDSIRIDGLTADVKCGGKKPGEIDLTVSGGTPYSDAPYYDFAWTDSTGTVFATTEDLDSLGGEQFYTVLVTDSLGCTFTETFFINEEKNVTLTASIDSAYCYGDLWTLNVDVKGGKPPYEYIWYDSVNVVIDTLNPSIVVSGGHYWVVVNDANGCDEDVEFIIEDPEELLADVVADDTTTCDGGAVLVHGNPLGGTGELSHLWSGNGAAYLDPIDSSDVIFSGAPAGNYQLVYTVTDENNCVAADSVEIEILPAVTVYDTMLVCEGEILANWNGQVISSMADSVYHDTLTSINGCDSLVTLNVFIIPPTYSVEDTTLCAGEPVFVWNSHSILTDRDSVYLDTLVNAAGCDSLLTFNVTVVPPTYSIDSMEICEGDVPIVWNSHSIVSTLDSVYLDTLVNANGCDSLLTMQVTVIPPTYSVDSMEICEGDAPIAWNNRTILSTVDSVYLDTLVNAQGCDSMLTLEVTVWPVTDTLLDTTMCAGEPSYVWNGLTIVSENDSLYQVVLPNQHGCDSTVSLNVLILEPSYSIEDTSLCEGEPEFAWNSHTVLTDRDSVYLDTLSNAAGCDSLLTYNVTILSPTYSIEDTSICVGLPEFAWNSHSVVSIRDSIYLDTLVNAQGCDSLLTFNVTVLPPSYSVDSMEICEGEAPLAWNSHSIVSTVDSIYLDTLVNAQGCDSLLTMQVTVIPPTYSVDSMEICEGDGPIAWNNRTILSTVDSVYLDTLVNDQGCDSMLTLEVTVWPVADTLLDTTMCAGEPSYVWNGLTIVSENDSLYQVVLPNQHGCDSTVSLNVIILQPTYSLEDTSLCEGEPIFAWNSHTVLTDRDSIYLDTLINAAGCDSLLTLNVTILTPSYSVEDTSICEGSPAFVWNSQSVSTLIDSVYQDTLTNAAGCDSLLTLNVTVIPPTFSIDSMELCEGSAPIAWNSNTIVSDRDSIYLDTLTNALGCDSLLTMKVRVLPPSFSIDSMELCEGSGDIAWNNRTILSTVDSIYQDTLINAAGCDSLLTMYVTVWPVTDTLLDTTLCFGSPVYAWNGQTVVTDKDSLYQVVLPNIHGCDSTVRLNVSVSPPSYSVEDTSLCEGEPIFAWNSHTVLTDRDSIYLDTLINAAGCDSLLTLNVTILTPSYSVEDTSICEGSPVFVWNSQSVSTIVDSIYQDVLVNRFGCDSLVTLNVSIIPPGYTTESMELCLGDPSVTWNGYAIVSTNDSSYIATLTNSEGCDSIVTMAVTILYPTYSEETMQVCENDATFDWNGNTILTDRDAVYNATLINAVGCDSILTLTVNSNPVSSYEMDTTLCVGAPSFVWNGLTITTDADVTYNVTLVNSFNCDSLVTFNVYVIPPDTTVIDTVLCEGSPEFVWHGNMVQAIFEDHYETYLPSTYGCDSLVLLNVRLIPVTDTVIDTMLCYGTPEFAWNNLVIYAQTDSIYQDTMVNAAGCDSLLTLNVTILYPDTINIDTTLCEGVPEFAWNSHIVNATQDSIYSEILSNRFGCDSIVTLDVQILIPEHDLDTMELCENDVPFAWYSHTVLPNRDSIYFDTLYYAAGCDSLRLQLEIITLPITDTLIDTLICEGSPEFVWNSHTISTFTDGIYRDTLINSYGCDSTLTLTVQIIPTYKDTIDLDVCYSDPASDWYGHTISSINDSIYMASLTTGGGCDSLIFLDVHILPLSDTVIDTLICEDEPEFAWNGNTVQTQNDSTYYATLKNVFGCDSSLIFNVTILRKTYSYTIDTIYDTDAPYAWNDSLYFDGGIYVDTLTNAVGCDSILTLDLTIIGLTITNVYDTICEPDAPYVWNGNPYDISGMYSDTLPRAAGGDSIVNLYLTINEVSYSELDITICAVDAPFNWNGTPYSLSGTYNKTLTNAAGCDSILTLNLIIIEGTYTEQIESACESFTWIGGNDSTYTESGTYDYIIGNSGCADTMRLILTIGLPIDMMVDPTMVSCYGYDDGAIDLSITEVLPPYSFLWSTGDTTEDLTNLTAGMYTVWVSDALGCGDSLTVEITQPDSIAIDLVQITDVAVNGESTGSIEVDVSGGTPGYSYEWIDQSGTVVDTVEDLFNQTAGIYTLTVTDANNCVNVSKYQIVQPKPSSCLDDITFICYEDLSNYPLIDSLQDYLILLKPGQGIDPGCGIDTSSFSSNMAVVSGSVFCYEEVRTYTLLDECGDTLFSCEQHVIVNDPIAPTMSCPPTIRVTNDVIPPAYTDTAEFLAAGGLFDDNCGVVSFRQVGADVSDGGTDPEVITRVYEVADYCGNVARCTQKIEVYLSAEFTIECEGLPNIAYECKADLPVYKNIAEFRADGGYAYSSPFAIEYFRYTDSSNGGKCPERITRTYTIENENGDVASCTQTFTIDDKTPPEFTIPDKFITCSDPMPRVYTTGREVELYSGNPGDRGVISDNCTSMKNATVYIMKQNKLPGSCPTIYERIYRVYDACGNETETSEFIYITDEIPPEIVSAPADIETDCYLPEPYADYSEFAAAGGNVNADCGATIRMAHIDDEVLATGVINRTYRFWDNCDSVDYVQKITIDDVTPPEFTQIPAPFTVDCEPVVFTSWTEFVGLGGWATDNCALDTGSFKLVSSVTSDDLCPKTYVNIYEIFDMSGNRDTMHHTVTVVDIEKPILTCPPSDTIDVTAAFPAPFETLDGFILGGGFASDNCGLDSASFTLVSSDSIISDCESQITYTYIVADNCGNWSDECSFTLYKRDYLDPEIYCPSDVNVACFDDAPSVYTTISEFEAAGGSISDNYLLDEVSFVHFDSIVGSNCPVTIIRTYQVADICGNTVSCSYQITINDTIPPVITCPADTAIECLSDVISDITTIEAFVAAGGKFDDNCEIDPNSFTWRTERVFTLSSTSIRNYFSISDLCGNIDSCVQVITLTDTIPPEAICNSITVQLDENGQYVLTDVDIRNISKGSNDNCTAEEDLIIEVDLLDFTCEDVEAGKQVNVVVTDEAGNSSVCMADIVVVDNIPPTAICQDITVYLDENGQVTVTGAMIDNGSFDNCKLDSIIAQPSQYDCNDVGDNPVKLIAVDAYGLRDTCEAIVTVIDEIPPYISCVGEQTVQLDQNGVFELTWEMVTDSVWDECAIDTVLLDDYQLDCDNIGITIITATAYDVNGNSSSCEIEFEVFGNVAPNVVNDSAVTAVDIPVEIPVVNNDYDLKTSINISSLGVVISPNHGSVTVDNKTGIVTYTPDPGYIGPDIFRYTICDDGIPCIPMCGEAIVFVTVRPANQPPVAIDDYFDVPCGDLFGNVLVDNGGGADSDPDGDEIVVNPIPIVRTNSGEIILYENGNFEYTPYEDFVGVDSFQYEIHDVGVPPSLYDTAWVYITRVADNDCDGIADVDDIDDDNDGIRDVNEGDLAYDSDLDGIPDSYDVDSDNDGILDNIEGQGEHNYIPPTGRDSDGDGWDDAYDPDNGGYPFDINLTDTDGDSMPDFLDIDSDNDGVFDFIEGHDENADGIADAVRIYNDSDFDGLDDAYDTQAGWAMPGNETASNAPLQDFDGDGERDWRDTNDEDDQFETNAEDINGNGDFSDDDLDLDGRPEYLDTEIDCELFIPEGFSPNDDGVHDFFQILCIYPRYPNAKMMIFNRNGNKLFEKENYGNYDVWGWDEAWWWGTSENKLTLGRSGGLPAGNYIYVLELNDGAGTVKNGTVMVAY